MPNKPRNTPFRPPAPDSRRSRGRRPAETALEAEAEVGVRAKPAPRRAASPSPDGGKRLRHQEAPGKPERLQKLLAHVLARWVPYYTYRATRTRFDAPQVSMTRLMVFMLIAAAVGVAQGWAGILTPTGLALFVWFLFMARHELKRDGAAMHWISSSR